MKKIISLLISVCILLSVVPTLSYAAAAGTTFTSGAFTYKVNNDTTTVTLTAIAASKLTGAITVPATVSDGSATYTVTHLADAFKNQGNKTLEMTSLVLPDTMTNFTGTATFYGCKNLKSIHLPKNLIGDATGAGYLTNTFNFCAYLSNVELPPKIVKCYGTFNNSCGTRTVTITGKSQVDFFAGSGTAAARAWADGITGITIYYPADGTIPTRYTGSFTATVKTYGGAPFTYGNFSYTINAGTDSVTLTAIATDKLSGAVTVPSVVSDGAKNYTVTQLGDAFKNQGNKTLEMTSLVLPDTITKFTGTATFYACKGLTSITLPKNLISDGSSGYGNCFYNTFQYCTKLTSVTLPASIVACVGTFQNSAVKTVTITGTNAVSFYCDSTSATSRAWAANTTGITIYYPENGTAPTRITGNGIGITAVRQGGEVEEPAVSEFSVGDFKYKVVEGTETVGVLGFSSTSDKAGEKVLPETVTYKDVTYTVVSVGYAAFANNANLTGFVMADTVTTVGSNIFYGCKNLTYVHLSESLANASASYQLVGTFNGCTALKTVVIPSGIKCLPKTFLNSGVKNIVLKAKGTELPKGSNNEYAPLSSADGVNVYYPSDGSVYGGYSSLIQNYFIYENNIAYVVKDDNTLTVASILPQSTLEGAVTIPSAIGALKVTAIADNAFENADDITSVVIADSVVSVGDGAFANCDNLKSVVLSKNLHGELKNTFAGCTKLSSVVIPEGITTLNGTFKDCATLNSVKLAQSVTTLTNQTFYGCSALTELVVPNTVLQITDGGNEAGTVFPSTITLVVQEDSAALEYAAANNINYIVKSVVEYSVNNGNAEVSKANFRIIDEYIIPETVVIDGAEYSVTSIASGAFADQDALTVLSIPNSVLKIPETAFVGCSNADFAVRVNSETSAYEAIKAVNVTYIADDAATSLAYKKYPSVNGLELYGAAKDTELSGEITIATFDGLPIVAIAENAFKAQNGITSVTMDDTVTSVGAYAFADCKQLETVMLSDNVEGTLDSTFVGCASLKTVDIPAKVTALRNTYNGCVALTRAMIPENIIAIYENTFANCTGLETVVIPETVTTFDRMIGFKDETQAEAEYVETNTSKQWADNPFKGATNGNLAICGVRGSVAEEFAYSSGIKFIDIADREYPLEYTALGNNTFRVTVRDIYDNGNVNVIGALYAGNKLLGCDPVVTNFNTDDCKTVYTKDMKFPGYSEDTTLKLMVWDDDGSVTPINKVATVSQPETIKIMVLGNSISNHGTSASSGWFAPDSQGMAATSLEKDFVHIVLNKAKEINPNVEVKIVTAWSLEANFDQWETLIASEYQDAVNYDADIIIAQFGENVKNNENEGSLGGSFDNDNEFNAAIFANIVKAFMKDGKDVPVISVTSMMSNKSVVLQAKEQACEENGWANVNLCNNANFKESKNGAYYLTPNQIQEGLELGTFRADVPIASGVYVHPGNNGMRAMAYGIWQYMEPIIRDMTFGN